VNQRQFNTCVRLTDPAHATATTRASSAWRCGGITQAAAAYNLPSGNQFLYRSIQRCIPRLNSGARA